jgi:hypothetical protein
MISIGSAQELLARASGRQRVEPADARAGAVFERVTVGAESFFVKRLSASSDWIMRIAGDHVHRPYLIWRSGIMDRAPDLIDHTVVAMDLTGAPGADAVLTIVMRDVGGSLVPPGDARVPAAQHDRKMGNLGSHPDGRTILLDWTLPGAGPACWDLCWYLALNRARLPEPKEAAISRFRAALERHGIATAAWWQEQLDLCLIGIVATFGWEKALGDAGELAWREAQVAGAAARQQIGLPV